MGSTANRKAAIDEFKKREPHRGVFAVRCTETGQTWVGATPNLEAAHNSTWFMLRLGSHRDPLLQAEWKAHGERAFDYEVLEELDKDVQPMLVADLLKEKKREWALKEHARTLLP
jgi:hypothetical protein